MHLDLVVDPIDAVLMAGVEEATASFFGDIDKFYDNVSHATLWQEGLATGFPPALLRRWRHSCGR